MFDLLLLILICESENLFEWWQANQIVIKLFGASSHVIIASKVVKIGTWRLFIEKIDSMF